MGFNRRGVYNLNNAAVIRRLNKVKTQAKFQIVEIQASFNGPIILKNNLQKGFNRHNAHNLIYKATYRRVLIGIMHAILKEAAREIQANQIKN